MRAPASRLVASGAGRTSRHARTIRITGRDGALFVKHWAAPGAWRAWRAFRMGEALVAAGFAAPETVLIAARGNAGLLVTRDAGGEELLAAAARLGADRRAKRLLLRGSAARWRGSMPPASCTGISCPRTCACAGTHSSSSTTIARAGAGFSSR
jgi:hypothetical protein